VAKAFQGRCLEEGLIVNAVDDHSIRLVPPLILGPQDIVEAGEKMRAALASTPPVMGRGRGGR
ncbi:MAG TPA: hypothetical protein VF137_00420, partial [Candidatus Dormibacteraeota bacterium]